MSHNFLKDALNANLSLNTHYIGVNGVKIQVILDAEVVLRKN
jgi:hypothetical protein